MPEVAVARKYPPFAVGPPVLPPDTPGDVNRTESVDVGEPWVITGENALLVQDPKYPWYEIDPTVGKTSLAKFKGLRELQRNEVESYLVRRTQYWQVVSTQNVLEKQTIDVSYEVGFTQESKESFSSVLAYKLGLVVKAGYAAGPISGTLTSELSGKLQTDTLERQVTTVREKRSVKSTLEPGFRVGWQLVNEFALYRNRRASGGVYERVSSAIVPGNDLVWTGQSHPAPSPPKPKSS